VNVDVSAGCAGDDDCIRIDKGCCRLGQYVAVAKSKAATYQAGLRCEAVSCPLIVVADDHSVAQCNAQTRACELVLPGDIACNGLTTNPHACPSGWRCKRHGSSADVPGRCLQLCGGIAGLQCSGSADRCIDDPDDDCDPARGGADCGGICVAPTE
jgi:hypothetical protein